MAEMADISPEKLAEFHHAPAENKTRGLADSAVKCFSRLCESNKDWHLMKIKLDRKEDESDMLCLMIDRTGLIVINIVCWLGEKLKTDSGRPAANYITYEGAKGDDMYVSPYSHAKDIAHIIENKIAGIPGISGQRPWVFRMVCYPSLSRNDAAEHGISNICKPCETIYKEDLADPEALREKLSGRSVRDFFICYGHGCKARKVYDLIYREFGNSGTLDLSDVVQKPYYQGESKVWEALEKNLPDSCVCYFNRRIELSGEDTIENYNEFDYCVVGEETGVVVIEVKGWAKKHFASPAVDDDNVIHLKVYRSYSPYIQAKNYAVKLASKLEGIPVSVNAVVCYPFLSRNDCRELGLDRLSAPENTLFAEDLDSGGMYKKLRKMCPGNVSRKVIGEVRSRLEALPEEIVSTRPGKPEPDKQNAAGTAGNKRERNASVPGYYSKLRVFTSKEKLSVSDARKAAQEWSEGIKQFIFVSTRDELKTLALELQKVMAERGICPDRGDLVFSASKKPVIYNGDADSFMIFGYQAFRSDHEYTCSISFPLSEKKDTGFNELNFRIMKMHAPDGFNADQYIIEHTDPDRDICVRAGAGTGKTFTMISRINYLIYNKLRSGAPFRVEDCIALVTFTNAATFEMKHRLKKLFRNMYILTGNRFYLDCVPKTEKMQISTIHSFARRIMANTPAALGIGSNFRNAPGTYDYENIISEVLDEVGIDVVEKIPDNIFGHTARDQIIEKFVSKLSNSDEGYALFEKLMELDPGSGEVDDILGKPLAQDDLHFVQKFYHTGIVSDIPAQEERFVNAVKIIITRVLTEAEKRYRDHLSLNNEVPLSHYIVNMKKCAESVYFNKNMFPFEYLFIDEFQDTNDMAVSAFRLYKEKTGAKLFVVGDLKQSIYGFNGASPQAFDNIMKNKKDWNDCSLTINYRSSSQLLNALDEVFTQMNRNGVFDIYSERDMLKGTRETRASVPANEVIVEKKYDLSKDNKFSWEQINSVIQTAVSQELERICGDIDSDGKLEAKERTIAVLTRGNYDAEKIAGALSAGLSGTVSTSRGRRIQVKVITNRDDGLLDRDAAKDLMKLIQALCCPDDPTALTMLLNSRYVNRYVTLETRNRSHGDNVVTEYEYASPVFLHSETNNSLTGKDIIVSLLDEWAGRVIYGLENDFTGCWKRFVSFAHTEPVLKVIHHTYTAARPYLNAADNDSGQYISDFHKLFTWAVSDSETDTMSIDLLQDKFKIRMLSRRNENFGSVTAPAADISDDVIRVICTTVHQAKGLEYGTVLIPFKRSYFNSSLHVRCADGKIGFAFTETEKKKYSSIEYMNDIYACHLSECHIDPHSNMDPQDIEEEARLLYVAMTRAMNKVIIVSNSETGPDEKEIVWRDFIYGIRFDGNGNIITERN